MYCSRCGRSIPDDAVFCKYCGQKMREEISLPASQPRPRKRLSARLIVLLCVLGAGMIAASIWLGLPLIKRSALRLPYGLNGHMNKNEVIQCMEDAGFTFDQRNPYWNFGELLEFKGSRLFGASAKRTSVILWSENQMEVIHRFSEDAQYNDNNPSALCERIVREMTDRYGPPTSADYHLWEYGAYALSVYYSFSNDSGNYLVVSYSWSQ